MASLRDKLIVDNFSGVPVDDADLAAALGIPLWLLDYDPDEDDDADDGEEIRD